MSITAQDNYFRVISWWDMPYGKVAKGMLIGHADKDDDKIYYETPRPPDDVTQILNYGKKQDDQFWERPETPLYWTKAYIDRIALEKFTIKNGRSGQTDWYWYMNPENLSDEQWVYQDTEWDRRMNGAWIFINGVVTYLTGKYYSYIRWWYLEDCYPEFRDRDLFTFYAWQEFCEDPLCSGGIFAKHRRAGDTSKWAYEGVEETTRTRGGHFGIQAAGKTGAGKVFTDKVVKGWKRWPLFFKPVSSSGDNPKTEIVMDVESRKGKTRHNINSAAEGLEGWIKYAANGDVGSDPFDGDKMIRYFRDEGGKEVLADILDTWSLVKPCLTNRRGRGKAAWPSTVEDVAGKYKGAFEKLYRDSMPSLAKTLGTGETRSGLKALFIPCYCGHEEYWFIGKFGESIVHKPTNGQLKWLLENRAFNDTDRKTLREIYGQGGAYEYELRRRAANDQNIAHKRKFPFTIEEVFAPNNPNCRYNLDKLTRMLNDLSEPTHDNSIRLKHLTVQGKLVWTEERFKSPVAFVEDAKGPFIFNKAYLPGNERASKLGIIGNNVRFDSLGIANIPGHVIKIGFDPQKQDAEDATGNKGQLSHAAGHAMIPYDPTIDPPINYADPNFSKDFISNACIFEYYNLPLTSKPTWEDMVKACVFLNAKFHSEKQVFSAVQFFKECGASRLLLRDPDLNGYNKTTGNVVVGQASNVDTESRANDRIAEYVDFWMTVDKFPFVKTITQLISYNGRNATKLDLKVSIGFTMMAIQPKELTAEEKQSMRTKAKAGEKPKSIEEATKDFLHLTRGY